MSSVPDFMMVTCSLDSLPQLWLSYNKLQDPNCGLYLLVDIQKLKIRSQKVVFPLPALVIIVIRFHVMRNYEF